MHLYGRGIKVAGSELATRIEHLSKRTQMAVRSK